MKKTKAIEVFYPDLDDSPYYRIPTIAKLNNGDILVGADQRQTTESDYGGVINPVLRIKKSNSCEFSKVIKVLENPTDGFISPTYTIDMSLSVDGKSGVVYMLLDKFKSLGNYETSKKGSGYIKKDGKPCLLLFERQVNNLLFNKEENRYYLKDGEVYSLDDKKTTFTVTTNDTYPYKKLGNLYNEGELVGNIFSDLSPIVAHQMPYLWFLKSEDGGNSFTSPIDITGQVSKDSMMFIGTCPGRGLFTNKSRIIFPIYYTEENPEDIYRNVEKAALIYSDDYGKTWQMSNSSSDLELDDEITKNKTIDISESQIVELSNGNIIMFSRTTAKKVVYAISYDGGKSFRGKLRYVDFKSEPFCMLSVVSNTRSSNEYILLSNPKGPGRENGEVKLLKVAGDVLKTVATKQINTRGFAYSAIEKLDDEEGFALLYEEKKTYKGENRVHIMYTEFDFEWGCCKIDKSFLYHSSTLLESLASLSRRAKPQTFWECTPMMER